MNILTKGQNIIGMQFGTLTVISDAPRHPKFKTQQYLCKCTCGSETIILRNSLIRGNSTRCNSHPKNDVFYENDYAIVNISTPKHPNTFTKIDIDDIEKVIHARNINGKFKWLAHDSSNGKFGLYVLGTDRKERLHRTLMNASPLLIVDHINGDTLDNRKSNLRVITRAENNKNMRKHRNNTSGYTGVTLKDGLWIAVIMINYKKIYLGGFDSKEHANIAYRAAAKVLGFSERHGNAV